MGIHIKIRKFSKKNSILYYHVNTEAFGGASFYIGIDAKDKKLFFYKTAELTSPISTVSLDPQNFDKVIPEIPDIPIGISYRVILKAYHAVEKNEFPEFLDYCA